MWWVHHVSTQTKQELHHLIVLPLLPPRNHFTGAAPLPEGTVPARAVAQARAVEDQSNQCAACHYSSSSSPMHAAEEGAAEHMPRAWPSNVNYTIYAGLSSCCSNQSTYTQATP